MHYYYKCVLCNKYTDTHFNNHIHLFEQVDGWPFLHSEDDLWTHAISSAEGKSTPIHIVVITLDKEHVLWESAYNTHTSTCFRAKISSNLLIYASTSLSSDCTWWTSRPSSVNNSAFSYTHQASTLVTLPFHTLSLKTTAPWTHLNNIHM